MTVEFIEFTIYKGRNVLGRKKSMLKQCISFSLDLWHKSQSTTRWTLWEIGIVVSFKITIKINISQHWNTMNFKHFNSVFFKKDTFQTGTQMFSLQLTDFKNQWTMSKWKYIQLNKIRCFWDGYPLSKF